MSTSKSVMMAAKIKAAKESMYKPESVFERLEREKRGGLVCTQWGGTGSGGATLGAIGLKTLHRKSGIDQFVMQKRYAMG